MVRYAIRYTPRGKRKSVYLKSGKRRKRVFRTKKGALRIKRIYDYKPKIRIIKLK